MARDEWGAPTALIADAKARIDETVKAKTQREQLKLLTDALFARTAVEDLSALSVSDQVESVKTAFKASQQRAADSHHITISNHTLAAKAGEVTMITICNDDMPFLYDSVTDLLQERGFHIALIAHPIVPIIRKADGTRTRYAEDGAKGAIRESLIHICLEPIDSAEAREELKAELDTVLTNVRHAVRDWKPMRARVEAAVAAYRESPPSIDKEALDEAVSFLEWLLDENFTFLGMREYGFSDADEMLNREGTGLGVLCNPSVKVLRRGSDLVTMTPEVREFMLEPTPLIISKANVRSDVHRRVHMDYIGVKLYAADGTLDAELRIVGLFTSTAYTRSVMRIPVIRQKVNTIVERSGLTAEGHSGKALTNILETYPRDELFQIDPDTLYQFSLSIAQLDDRPRVRVLVRRDRFDRFVSILVYVPRDRYSTEVRIKIGTYLADVFDGRVSAFYPGFPEGSLARVHFVIGRTGGKTPNIPQATLETEVAALIRTWQDDLTVAITDAMEPAKARELLVTYSTAFRAAYRAIYGTDQAVRDIDVIETLSPDHRLAVTFRTDDDDSDGEARLRLYHYGGPIPLSDRMPIIENFGFRAVNEETYRIKLDQFDQKRRIWIHDILLQTVSGRPIDVEDQSAILIDAFQAVWSGRAENDGFNALTLNTALPWRDVAVVRAYSRYMRQILMPYSQDYIWQVMNTHAEIAFKLVDYFHARFNPNMDHQAEMREAREAALLKTLEMVLSGVDSLDEDRIIRGFLNLIQATLRTNYFQQGADGAARPTIVFKVDPHMIEGLPLPRPYREIFVYSPRVEGVHLRFGAVARGGLRWSDRPQDFRTEVLGLVKAQQVKNAVIVPVGAKGGFVPKQLPTGDDRNAWFEEGRESYKVFINSLLDVTDNLDGADLIAPENVVRLDGDDPYLVVAADKGTATFSDTANAISQSRDFWLDDAFASGGSAGYDHKKMGITARGGWEAVKRHFREMDWDIQTQPFTVVGCGDMSGDVFGNGMLLSEQIKLVAAFDHRDIFIDPDPDPANSFAERKRLFEMGRSSWKDYDEALISKGGGVFSRSQKALQISQEIRDVLDIPKSRVSPFELITAILKADADLLWFGGIGTYVRAPQESDADVGDRANDAVRITTDDLRVKVIGEGANLGVTQKARIAFGLGGGRVNSDAIDNSAGVNSSDVEVNIKIALGAAVRAGKLKIKARNTLLASMTDEVADLVLRNNYQQTLALSIAERRGLAETEFQARFMADLEGRGLLDRAVEDLPDPIALSDRIADGKPLTRPELAVLLAYAKITLFDDLLATDVPDDPYFERDLIGYFPSKMQKKYASEIGDHRLRREIVATFLANSMINRGGPVFVNRLVDQTGASLADIARAYAATRAAFDMPTINAAIDALDTKIGGLTQVDLYRRVQDLLWRQTPWFLRYADFSDGIGAVAETYRKGIAALAKSLDTYLEPQAVARRDAAKKGLADVGVPDALAKQLADMEMLEAATDVIRIAENTASKLSVAAKIYFGIGSTFGTDTLMAAMSDHAADDYFDRVALNQAMVAVATAQRRIAETVIADHGTGAKAIDAWQDSIGVRGARTREMVSGLSTDSNLSVSKFSVAAAMLGDLAPA